MSTIHNMRGKSWAMLHSLFQNWLLTSFPPEQMPDSETVMLMWASWRASHETHIAGLRADNAMLREDNENLRQELSARRASDGFKHVLRPRSTTLEGEFT